MSALVLSLGAQALVPNARSICPPCRLPAPSLPVLHMMEPRDPSIYEQYTGRPSSAESEDAWWMQSGGGVEGRIRRSRAGSPVSVGLQTTKPVETPRPAGPRVAEETPGLPVGWAKYTDPASGRPYYSNGKESQFEWPGSPMGQPMGQSMGQPMSQPMAQPERPQPASQLMNAVELAQQQAPAEGAARLASRWLDRPADEPRGGGSVAPSNAFAAELFQKYDVTGKGVINEEEFQAIAADFKAKASRRKALQIASAVVGALVVSQSSSEYQWAQKTFRPLYVEGLAETSQGKMFPTARLSSDVDAAVARTLAARGFNPANTLFSHSVCSDEVNGAKEQLMPLMVDRWGEGFALGGLAGLPFAGKSGFRAYLHHVPDNGKLLVMFAPHVGVDADGRIGALQREGQSAVSKACGAAIGAFKAIGKQNAERAAAGGNVLAIVDDKKADAYDEFDPEIQQIVSLLRPKLEGIEKSANDVGFVTYQMYGIVRDLINACITQTPDVWEWTDEVAVVGGIIINRKTGGDFFQPLSFQSRMKDKTVDLYEDAFGARPDLGPILGTNAVAQEIYGTEKLESVSRALREQLPAF